MFLKLDHLLRRLVFTTKKLVMLIIGAKGFAKELLEDYYLSNSAEKISFYDDVNADIGDVLFRKFPILKTEEEVRQFFLDNDNKFTIGIGNPLLRFKLFKKFVALNGIFTASISPYARIGSFDNSIGDGSNIMANMSLPIV